MIIQVKKELFEKDGIVEYFLPEEGMAQIGGLQNLLSDQFLSLFLGFTSLQPNGISVNEPLTISFWCPLRRWEDVGAFEVASNSAQKGEGGCPEGTALHEGDSGDHSGGSAWRG
ncbi:MAG: hypothetical protein ACK4Z6_04765 [Candidatus Methylomirabilales bacterium]